MKFSMQCWCENSEHFAPFSPGYWKCLRCGTLVAAHPPGGEAPNNSGDENQRYGREYWITHQIQDLHLPDISQRARQDLPERCIYWLTTILKYKLPPARVLELGSGHGGFVALLRFSGFDATGLEVSPWVVEFASKTFHVPMLLGVVEEQQLEPGSLDMIILMDVLEHLPAPEKTIRYCLRLLKPNGIFVIQTPCLPEGKTYEDLESRGDPFLEMLIGKEHLYLFSRSSIREFFHRLQIDHLELEPAIFSRHDMFLVASREPLISHSSGIIEETLNSSPAGKIVQALADSYIQKQDLVKKYQDLVEKYQVKLHRLFQKLQESQAVLKALFSGRVFRILRKMGFWGRMEDLIRGVLVSDPQEKGASPNPFLDSPDSSSEKKLRRIAVDLTPLLPGAENGGAKLLAMELIRHISQLVPHCEFVLLTSSGSHDELSVLDSPNVRRLCVRHLHAPADHPPIGHQFTGWRIFLLEWLKAYLPGPLLARAKTVYHSWQKRPISSGVLRQLGAQLLLCPFTMPFFSDPNIPVVSVVYDLQFAYYPQFFSSQDWASREYHFRETCRLANLLVCISDYVRETVLWNSNLSPARVVTIPIRLSGRLKKPGSEDISVVLRKNGLEENGFLLYPANFWPHKNHSMLLTSFGMYRSRHPESRLRLVCTGFPDERMDALREAVQRMGLRSFVILPGYLSEEELAALLASCKALIFPSLYEGFGMPVLEAMAFSKPILCSNVASLPEVAGDGALLFDPKKPHEILAAMERIIVDSKLASSLVERGKARIAQWGSPEQMAREYLAAFNALAVKNGTAKTLRR